MAEKTDILIGPYCVEFTGVTIKDRPIIDAAMEICHRMKHMYLEGFPCGKKTRKKDNMHIKRWVEYPGICFTYLVCARDRLTIKILVSDVESLQEKYTLSEIDYYAQMYINDVAGEMIDKIIKYLPD